MDTLGVGNRPSRNHRDSGATQTLPLGPLSLGCAKRHPGHPEQSVVGLQSQTPGLNPQESSQCWGSTPSCLAGPLLPSPGGV